MKKLLCLLVIVLCSHSRSYAQKPFEGTITITGSANGTSADAVANVKGTQIMYNGPSTILGSMKIYIALIISVRVYNLSCTRLYDLKI